MAKKNFVTRAFTRNMNTHSLDCVSCSNQGNLSVSVDLTSGKFEIKNCTMNLYAFSKEIEIYLNVCETLIKQRIQAVEELKSDLLP